MKAISGSDESTLARCLAELAKERFAKYKDRTKALRFTLTDIGRAVPREWYDRAEEPHISKAAKERIKAEARQLFGDYGRHGGRRVAGDGKQLGRPKTGRKALTKSITLPWNLWVRLDKLRGEESRSRFLQRKIQAMRPQAPADLQSVRQHPKSGD